eukprot:scpid83181/ scgid2740/ Mitochondrial import inner membrane translocase subunit tim16-A; Presequence translocated-associated motor subunit pam16-A
MPVRIIAQIIVQGGQIVTRAFTKALRAEYETIQQARKATAHRETQQSAAASTAHGMTLQEAKDILAIEKMDTELIKERFDTMYKANAKKNGGSFYLQSKVRCSSVHVLCCMS